MQVKLFFAGLFCFMCSSVLYADYDEANLDKLFTDKNQRARIDAVRSGNVSDGSLPKSSKIKVSGYVIRSGGKSVVWVNNKNTLESTKLGDVKVQPTNIGKNKTVGITADGKHKHLKPGEVWHKETGRVVDDY